MATFHARSNSFPSRPNSFASQIEEKLCRINSSKSASSSEIYNNLCSLQDLHDSVDKLLLLPQTQQTFSKEQNKKMLSEVSDASLKLLDLCGSAKDALMQTKESTRDLQSAIRRKIEGQETEVKKYLASRKAVKKAIKKAAESLKGTQKKSNSSHLAQDQESLATLTILKNMETATLSVFEALFSFVTGAKASTKPGSWSMVSKLMNNKRVRCDPGEGIENEFEKIDLALCRISKFENVQDKLKDLDLSIQDLEESLECLYRRLIKTRVSLLNILNH